MDAPKKRCGICGDSGHNHLSNLMTLQTKYSGTYVYKLLERFIEYDLPELSDIMADSTACMECFGKLNDYDAAYTKAIIIQKELLDILKQSPLGIVTDLEMLDTDVDDEYVDDIDEDSVTRHEIRLQDTVENSQETLDTETLELKPAPEATQSGSTTSISLRCRACGMKFEDLREMQQHKHVKPDIDSDDDDWNGSNLLIESVQSPVASHISDESEDLAEHSVDTDFGAPADSLSEEYIVEEEFYGEEHKNLVQLSGRAKRRKECYYCDDFFPLKETLKDHIEKVHATENGTQHKCKTCGFLAKTRAALCNHFAKHSRPSIACHICNKVFQQRGTLVRHMVVHTRKTSYYCNLCGKGYIHYSSYYMHKLAHKDIRLKKCEICGYELRSTSHLKRHMRTHSGEKPFTCPECGQKFSQRYNMVTHLNGHKGITRKSMKKFVCQLCQNVYARKIVLRQHLQVEHGISDKAELDKAVLIISSTSISEDRRNQES